MKKIFIQIPNNQPSGGIVIVTVSSFNLIRSIKRKIFFEEICFFLNPLVLGSHINVIRKILHKKPIQKPFHYNRNQGPWEIYPIFGDFFEYRFSKEQFEKILKETGFEILESVPIAHLDGVYHEFGRCFVSFRNWQFYPNILGKLLNQWLSKKPFCHNHLHLCVVRKD